MLCRGPPQPHDRQATPGTAELAATGERRWRCPRALPDQRLRRPLRLLLRGTAPLRVCACV